MTTELKNNHEE